MTDPERAYPTYQKLVIRALTRHPESAALVDGPTQLSGQQLHERVARMVSAYRGQRLDEHSRIALMGANSADYVVAQFAAAALGATFTGVHPLASPTEVTAVLRQLDPAALVFGPGAPAAKVREVLTSWPQAPMALLCLGPSGPGTDLLALERASMPAALDDPGVLVGAEAAASISFTGGTTGSSKGVLRSQRALACSLLTMLAEWDWPAELRFLALAPLTHATGAMVPAVLLRGGCVHIRPGFDVDDVHRQVATEHITATFLVPTMVYRLLDTPASRDPELASLRMIIYGAAPISAARLAEGLRRWGRIFMQLYGQVEAPNTISTLSIAAHTPGDPVRLGSCGKPTLAIEVQLQDLDGEPVPPGAPGEICVRGPLVMDGYLGDPQATAAAFRNGWLRTGDLATRDDNGYLTIVGRLKDMIVSGGLNIFAGEVEHALSSHPLVKECAVIGVPDEVWGEAVTAYVVPTDQAQDPDEGSLVAHVRSEKGPAWCPKRIHFVDALPVTGLGKPDKKALRSPHWAGSDRAVH